MDPAGNIVGAIANKAWLDGAQINGIDTRRDHSLVRLPEDMPSEVLLGLCGCAPRISFC